jgi:hypothetical protein
VFRNRTVFHKPTKPVTSASPRSVKLFLSDQTSLDEKPPRLEGRTPATNGHSPNSP